MFRFIPDTNTQFQAMRGGEVDMIARSRSFRSPTSRGGPGIRVQSGPEFAGAPRLQLGSKGHRLSRAPVFRQAIAIRSIAACTREGAVRHDQLGLTPLQSATTRTRPGGVPAELGAVRVHVRQGWRDPARKTGVHQGRRRHHSAVVASVRRSSSRPRPATGFVSSPRRSSRRRRGGPASRSRWTTRPPARCSARGCPATSTRCRCSPGSAMPGSVGLRRHLRLRR